MAHKNISMIGNSISISDKIMKKNKINLNDFILSAKTKTNKNKMINN